TFVYKVNDTAREISNCTLYFSNVANSTNITIQENTNQNITNSTPELESLQWFVSCYDNQSRQGNSSVWTLDTKYNTPTPPGPGYKGTKYAIGTLEAESSVTQTNLRRKDTIELTISETEHTATITDINTNSIDLTVASTNPTTKTITVGGSAIYDLIGATDLKVTLNSITSNRASITLVTHTAPAITPIVTEEETTTQEKVTGETVKESPEEKTNTTWIWVLGIIVIAGIAYTIIRKTKK
ncbi:hypothetical protein K8R33_05230, partial [archaeon]|nr:hypothetical protein [archaeon]